MAVIAVLPPTCEQQQAFKWPTTATPSPWAAGQRSRGYRRSSAGTLDLRTSAKIGCATLQTSKRWSSCDPQSGDSDATLRRRARRFCVFAQRASSLHLLARLRGRRRLARVRVVKSSNATYFRPQEEVSRQDVNQFACGHML